IGSLAADARGPLDRARALGAGPEAGSALVERVLRCAERDPVWRTPSPVAWPSELWAAGSSLNGGYRQCGGDQCGVGGCPAPGAGAVRAARSVAGLGTVCVATRAAADVCGRVCRRT